MDEVKEPVHQCHLVKNLLVKKSSKNTLLFLDDFLIYKIIFKNTLLDMPNKQIVISAYF